MTGTTAERLVDARLNATALPEWPGDMPTSMDEAYATQDLAIGLWPDRVAGWKVGLVPPQYRAAMGTDRLLGPIFASAVVTVDGHAVAMPVFEGGFGAVEAEFIIEVAADADPAKHDYSVAEAEALIARVRIGVEPAGSPYPHINGHGPAVTVSDFGNNAGLYLGAEIDGWRERAPDSLRCRTEIDGEMVGEGSAASVPGGPASAFAFALGLLAKRGRPLKRGDLVTTGAVTGIHQVVPGQKARVMFEGIGEIACETVAATPR